MKRFRLLNALLLGLIALAGWRTAEVWQREPPAISPDGDAGKFVEGLPPPPRKPMIPQMVNTIAQQDLFDASRKEDESASSDSPTPEATPPPPPTLKLAGVIFVGMEPEAVLTDSAQGNKQIRLRVGEEISGYRVDRISAETIALVSGAGEEVLLPLLLDTSKRAVAFGPGGRQQKQANAANAVRRSSGQRAQAQAKPGSFAPKQNAQTEAERRREDARRRAERARERLKRLRAEAAKNR